MPPLNRVRDFQSTPNPNALKCLLERPIPGPVRSHRDASQSDSDPLAAALLNTPGLVGVLISNDWITVNKAPDADWSRIKPAVQRILAECPSDLPAHAPREPTT
ncbi:MAG: NifU N-terminal domain-containing protein [Phycisphaeraceae bacterium]|nr:NifU N-terminal domain-containing protein [Phycisphaeraceae bacterium]